MTTLLDRLLGKIPPEPESVTEFKRALRELSRSSEELAKMLDADPCASDPTRVECGPELSRQLHRRGDPSRALRIARNRRGA